MREFSMCALEARRLLAVPQLTLLNADTDQPVTGVQLENGASWDLAATGRRLSIRADFASPAGSVRFNYDGLSGFHVENFQPYAIAGDALGGTDYLPWTPSVGMHTLVITSYTQPMGSGDRLE